ncbi:MAG: hypothetical protein ACHQAX_08480 [Gammaproteobacteria bacterium]
MRHIVYWVSCLWPVLGFAFGDDICFYKEPMDPGRIMFNCVELHESCYPLNTDQSCKTQTAHHTIDASPTAQYLRSMVHMDATFYIAQAVGLPYDEAYRIAAYDQSIDLGGYVPVDRHGVPLVEPAQCETETPPENCKYVAKPLNALVRTNLSSGGTFFHYGVLNNPTQKPVNGLDPLKNESIIENMLTNLRAWIFSNALLCTAGLNGREVGTCYHKSTGLPGKIYGAVPVLEDDERLDQQFNITLTEQILHETEAETIFARDIGAYVGEANANDAKMGIYLHVLQDRISHHSCMDTATLSDPLQTADENFVATYDPAVCHQGIHLVWHGWEAGQVQSEVPAEQQTMYPSLSTTYDELLLYAELHRTVSPLALDPQYKKVILDKIYLALQQENPPERIAVLIAEMKVFGLKPMPGYE